LQLLSSIAENVVKLPSNFMHCGAKFQRVTRTVGKKSLFLAR